MTKWVRVKDPVTGHEISVSEEQANIVSVKPLPKPATAAHGGPRPVTYQRTLVEAAAAAKVGA